MRDLRILTFATLASALGSFAGVIALWVGVHERTGSGFAVAALFIALWGPVALGGGIAGRMADRYENRRIVIVGSLLQAAAALALVFTTVLPVLLVLVAVLGAATAVVQPAEFALIPHAVGEDRVQRANGRLEAVRALGMTAGPLVGGALAAAGSAQLALALNAATFTAVAIGAMFLHARRHPTAAATARPVTGSEQRAAVRALLGADRTLAIVLAGAIASLVFASISMTVEVFFAKDVLGAGDVGFAALIAAWTAGMVLGSAGVGGRVPPAALAAGALVAVAIQGAGLAAAGAAGTLALALVGYALGGTAHGAKNTLVRTLLHERVPEDRRGRAFASYNAARNAVELGALGAGGVVLGLLGARGALLLAGLGALAVGLVALQTLLRPQTRPITPTPEPTLP
jgi:MFS family permease